ncbi:hypothetical protein HNR23_000755 [Nocardiopsis mwathae]|uniref:Asparagine synthase n=1 Tax=Nocardiopsis mwathae TaxID=1472723 RepID=A0A7W9YEH3_9ACTN|nr:hypothetical protein [Nocardiopsis mwathae]MBB6170695.1 hypothetical protein [Nocardiopsis mwathae]
MRFYLALAAAAPRERAPIPRHVTAAARILADLALPVPEASLRHRAWTSPDGTAALLCWTNEPEHPDLPEPLTDLAGAARAATPGGTGGVLGHTGYLADPGDLEALRTTTGIGPLLDRTGGAFGVFRALPHGFDAVTSISRTDPVYHGEGGGLHVAANRALLAHLVLRAAENGEGAPLPPAPVYDVPPMQALVRHGFYITDDTPFAGIRALGERAALEVRDGKAQVISRDLPTPEPARPGRRRRARTVDELADALVAAVEPVRRHPEGVSLSLTGGRDSRVIAAALHAAGIGFRATTRGVDDHPDVVLARRICAALGVGDHRVLRPRIPPEQAADPAFVLAEHPRPRTLRLLRMTEGMNSAFEDVIAPHAFVPEARLSGSGGEALRGGWLKDQADLSHPALIDRLRTITLAQSPMMTPEAEADGEALFESFRTAYADDPALALDHLYLRYRTGRWLTGSRTATLCGYRYYHPFLDHRVLGAVHRLSPRWRWSEELVLRLLERLAPPLARMPVADHPWRFDHRRVLNPLHRRARRRRPVLRAASTVGGFDWRRRPGPDYVAPMRERILDTPELFRLVDRAATERILTQDPTPRPGQVWNLYTIALLLSGEWLASRGAAPDEGRIGVPIR